MTAAAKPLCFVLMPFGTKPDENNRPVDFDAVYAKVIRPAVLAAGLDCIRADEEQLGGIIHKPMFERLLLCDYAVADLTTANANVFYELGIRHALRPHRTVLLAATGFRPPFDLVLVRLQRRYRPTGSGRPAAVKADRTALQEDSRSRRTRRRRQSRLPAPGRLVAPTPDPTGAAAFRDRVAAAEARVRRSAGPATRAATP